MVAVKSEGKTSFVRQVLEKRPQSNPKAVNQAWNEAGHEGSISGTLVQKIRAELGLTGNIPTRVKSGSSLAKKAAPVVNALRLEGVTIIHAPSDCMAYYKDAPQRKRMLALAKVDPPTPLGLPDLPLPIDDKSGGCDTPDQFYKAWTREHPGIRIDKSDVISDNGAEIYSFLRERDIRTLLVMGVHANMCILNRTFAIKRMTNLGIRCILVRDLTDAMYNPQDPPRVSHDAGTQLVIEYIEKYWAPTTTSADLLREFAR